MEQKENINEIAPPGSSGSVRAMIVKHKDKFDPEGKGGKMNPYAIAWAQHNKGAKWKYKAKKNKDTTKGAVPKKKKKYRNESISFKEWMGEKEDCRIDEMAMQNGASPSEINSLTPFQLAQKTQKMVRPKGVGPFAYAILLKMQMKQNKLK